ncbi:MAG: IclR family transcriptional regulator [Pigmentiphaga sp.]|nr:IclR family transcriptional regulator [Pigmentiphaga sp.]
MIQSASKAGTKAGKKSTDTSAKGETGLVASVERALDILDAFESGLPSMTLTELAERAGLYKSTALRLVETLLKYEYLIRLSDGSYQVGPRPFLLGARYQSNAIHAEWVLPVLRELVDASQESAAYNVRHQDYRVCLWRINSPRLIRDHTQPGDVRPMGRGAAGKLLMAFSSPERADLARLRERPIALSFGEIENDMAGIATPVFANNGEILGALTLSGPSSRFTSGNVVHMERLLWDAAKRLTKRVGGDMSRFRDEEAP